MTLNFQSTPVLFGEKLKMDGDDDSAIDLGFVGEVTRIDRNVIENLCYRPGTSPIHSVHVRNGRRSKT